MKTQVIIPAAGLGSRLKSSTPKPLILLNDKPLIVYALESFEKCPNIASIIIAVAKEYISDYNVLPQKYGLTKVKRIIEGGQTRRDSVANALAVLDKDTENVLVHDGARPFVTVELIDQCLSVAFHEDAVIAAVPLKATIKKVNLSTMFVEETVDRKMLREIQTPQVFRKEIIQKAHREVLLFDPCDDALLVEKLGIKVKVMAGSEKNIKITTKEDIDLAEALLKVAETKKMKKKSKRTKRKR